MGKTEPKGHWDPGTLLEMSGYYWKTCTLHAGVKLDVFSTIGSKSLTCDQINAELNCDREGLLRLLNALSALKLLNKEKDIYTNTEAAKLFLSKSSPRYIGFMIMHHHHLMASWHRMDQAVKEGGPIRERSSFTSEEWRGRFLMGMFNIGMAVAPGLSKTLDLSDCKRLLDLGGGPGTFAIHFCLANPGMMASVYDLPTTEPFARKTMAGFKVEDRVDFIPGDYTKQELDFPDRYDAVWLSHILHGEDPRTAADVVRKAVSALKPGGKILIHEFILTENMDAPLFPALFSINMYLGTEGGQSYSQGQLSDMLEACGVGQITRHPFVGPTESGILTGRKEG